MGGMPWSLSMRRMESRRGIVSMFEPAWTQGWRLGLMRGLASTQAWGRRLGFVAVAAALMVGIPTALAQTAAQSAGPKQEADAPLKPAPGKTTDATKQPAEAGSLVGWLE